MNKFSKIEKNPIVQEDTLQWKGNFLSVNKYKDYEFVSGLDSVIILPYFPDDACILLRQEPIPSFQHRFKNNPEKRNNHSFLTCISGGIEEKETTIKAIRRELYEESGVILSDLLEIPIEGPFFLNKGNNSYCYFSILELRYNDYKQVKAPTDGTTNEINSRTVKISIGDLDDLRINDLPTQYLLTKFKKDFNIKF